MNIKIITFLLICTVLFSGCTSKKLSTDDIQAQVLEQNQTISDNDPLGAIDEIYENITIKGVITGNDKFVTEILGIDEKYFYGSFTKKTDGKYGISDIYFIEKSNVKEAEEKIISALNTYKEKIINECTDYNIYNSLEIAQNAEIYYRGNYIIFLMLEDNDSAKEIIKKYVSAK